MTAETHLQAIELEILKQVCIKTRTKDVHKKLNQGQTFWGQRLFL